MAKTDRFKRSYEFLCQKETTAERFTLPEVCDATGWKPGTPRTYLTKKWLRFVTPEDDGWTVRGVSQLCEADYLRYMSQVARPAEMPTHLPDHVASLAAKSREAAFMAVDSCNRPGIRFRSEAFIVLMTIAWRCALHALLEKSGVDYIYRNEDGTPRLIDGEPKAWELAKCVSNFFDAAGDQTRHNLTFMIGLRNKIEHRYIPELDPHVAGECQAMLLNLEQFLAKHFGTPYLLNENLYIPLHMSSTRTGEEADAMKRLQADHFEDVKDLHRYRSGFSRRLGL